MSVTRAIIIIASIIFLLLTMQRCINVISGINDIEKIFQVSNEKQCIEQCFKFLEQNNKSKVNPIYLFEVDLGTYSNKSEKVTKIIRKTCRCLIP